MKKCADVRRYNGKYRVYVVEHTKPRNGIKEIRYSLKVDAMDYIMREGCHDWWWVEFDDKEKAQEYLDENRGYTWW